MGLDNRRDQQMKCIIVATWLLASLCAQAQPFAVPSTGRNPCGFAPPTVDWIYGDLATTLAGAGGVAVNAVSCAPAPVGTGTVPTVRWNAAGVVGWYHCQRPDGRWTTSWGAETWPSFRSHVINADVLAVAQATDPVAALNAILSARVALPLADPSLTPVWCPYAREMIASQPAQVVTPPTPVPATWWVAKYSTQPTRPAFPLTSGVRGTVSSTRAPVGAVCDCTASVVEGVTTYCAFTGGGGTVAVCTKVAP